MWWSFPANYYIFTHTYCKLLFHVVKRLKKSKNQLFHSNPLTASFLLYNHLKYSFFSSFSSTCSKETVSLAKCWPSTSLSIRTPTPIPTNRTSTPHSGIFLRLGRMSAHRYPLAPTCYFLWFCFLSLSICFDTFRLVTVVRGVFSCGWVFLCRRRHLGCMYIYISQLCWIKSTIKVILISDSWGKKNM